MEYYMKTRELRKKLKWTQSDIATLYGVSQSKVSKFERGEIDSLDSQVKGKPVNLLKLLVEPPDFQKTENFRYRKIETLMKFCNLDHVKLSNILNVRAETVRNWQVGKRPSEGNEENIRNLIKLAKRYVRRVG